VSRSGGALFFGGVPTEPDVRALVEKYGVPEEGTKIPYAEVAELIRTQPWSSRFCTVTARWRNGLLKDHNVKIGAVAGCFNVLTPDERISMSINEFRSGVRSIERSVRLNETTDRDRLSPEMRAESDHVKRCAGAIRLATLTEAKKYRVALPE